MTILMKTQKNILQFKLDSSFNSNSTQNNTRVLSFTPKLKLNSTQNFEFKTCIGLMPRLGVLI